MNDKEAIKLAYEIKRLTGIRQCFTRVCTGWMIFFAIMLFVKDVDWRTTLYAIFGVSLAAYIIWHDVRYHKVSKQLEDHLDALGLSR